MIPELYQCQSCDHREETPQDADPHPDVGKARPAYWAITAIHEVSLDGAGLADVGTRIGVLWGFFAVIAGLALVQFRYHRE